MSTMGSDSHFLKVAHQAFEESVMRWESSDGDSTNPSEDPDFQLRKGLENLTLGLCEMDRKLDLILADLRDRKA